MTIIYSQNTAEQEEIRRAEKLKDLQERLDQAVSYAKDGIGISPELIPNLRNEVEVAQLALEGAKERAQKERDRLPSAEDARAAIQALVTAEEQSRIELAEHAKDFAAAHQRYFDAVVAHNKLIDAKVSEIHRLGLPSRGVHLDGKAVVTDGVNMFRHGSTIINYVSAQPLALDSGLKELIRETNEQVV